MLNSDQNDKKQNSEENNKMGGNYLNSAENKNLNSDENSNTLKNNKLNLDATPIPPKKK